MHDHYYDNCREEIKKASEKAESLPYERIWCKSADGLNLSARFYENGGEKLVIFCHGIHAVPWHNFGVVGEDYRNHGYDILLIEERTHWESEGNFVTYGYRESEDFLLWLDKFRDKPYRKIVLHGVSMGATALAMASDRIVDERVTALILDCGFTSLRGLGESLGKYQHLPKWLFKIGLHLGKRFGEVKPEEQTQTHLSRSKIPCLFLHGAEDDVVTKEHSMANYDACSSRKELYIVESAGHAVSTILGGPEIRQKIFQFIGE